jgi:hypothetical protein
VLLHVLEHLSHSLYPASLAARSMQ